MSWPLPDRIPAWYLVASSRELRRGTLRPFELGGEAGLVARGQREVLALGARCPHMGASLARGTVDGDRVVCPLHGIGFDRDGACVRRGVDRATAFAVTERCGGVFVFGGPPDLASTVRPPGDGLPRDLVWRAGRVQDVTLAWGALVATAFDLHHLAAIRQRELLEDPIVDAPDPNHLRLRYSAKVRGGRWSDRLIRLLGRGRLQVTVTTGGPTTAIETRIGRLRSAMVVGLLPTETGTALRALVAVPRGPLAGVRGRVAQWLYGRLLVRELTALDGSRFDPRSELPEDQVLQRLVGFLESR